MPCGTYGGFQRHGREGSPACRPCQDARNQYMRDLRANRADIRENDRLGNRARSRALYRLAALHRDEYERLWLEELPNADVLRGKKVAAA